MWELRVKFHLGQNKDCSPEDNTSVNSERLFQRGSGERTVHMWFWQRGNTCNQTHIFFVENFCWSHEASASWETPETIVTMKDFIALLDMRIDKNWAHKISSWEYWPSKDLSCKVPRVPSASFLLSTLNSFKGCWRSAAAVALNLILVETDGKQPQQVPVCGWHICLVSLCLSKANCP